MSVEHLEFFVSVNKNQKSRCAGDSIYICSLFGFVVNANSSLFVIVLRNLNVFAQSDAMRRAISTFSSVTNTGSCR